MSTNHLLGVVSDTDLSSVVAASITLPTANAIVSSGSLDLLNLATAADREAITYGAISNHLERLEHRQKVWTTGIYARANDELYDILASCLQLVQLTDAKLIEARNAALKSYCELRKIYLNRDTPIATMIVSVVFGAEIGRRRTSVYSICLRAAAEAKISPETFAQWVKKQGGIEQCRLNKSPDAESGTPSREEKASYALEYLNRDNGLGVMSADKLAQAADRSFSGKPVLVIAEQQSDGSQKALAIITDTAVVTTALVSIYTRHNKAVNDFLIEQELRERLAA